MLQSMVSQRVRHDLATEQQEANFCSLKTEKIPTGRVALGDWLGCYKMDNRVGILPNMGSGNWRVMATVSMGLGKFQRFLSCDLGIGLLTELIDIFSPS